MRDGSKGQEQLQDLYSIDHTGPRGNVYLAWYGQCRAKEMSHEEAMRETIAHFHIDEEPWYILRQERKKEREEHDRQIMERSRARAKKAREESR